MQIQLIFILVMALMLAVFTFQNPYPVQMKFMGWQSGQVPIIIIVIIALLAGIVVSLLLNLKQTSELKKLVRRQQKEINDSKLLSGRPAEDSDEN